MQKYRKERFLKMFEMKVVHSEVYMGKTIEIFYRIAKYEERTSVWDNGKRYTVKINGEWFTPKSKNGNEYWELSKAIGGAKSSIKKNATRADEIARLEEEIATLQAKLDALRNV
jgi:hypothetical protein